MNHEIIPFVTDYKKALIQQDVYTKAFEDAYVSAALRASICKSTSPVISCVLFVILLAHMAGG